MDVVIVRVRLLKIVFYQTIFNYFSSKRYNWYCLYMFRCYGNIFFIWSLTVLSTCFCVYHQFLFSDSLFIDKFLSFVFLFFRRLFLCLITYLSLSQSVSVNVWLFLFTFDCFCSRSISLSPTQSGSFHWTFVYIVRVCHFKLKNDYNNI
jgi:hypothetical protein